MQRRLIIVVGVVGLFSALIVTSLAMAGKPATQVRGQGKVQLGDPADVSVSHVSVNAWADGAGVAHGSLEWVGGVGPDTKPTAYPWHMNVTSIDVIGNTATVCWVVVLAPVPDDTGIEDCFVFTDGTPDTIAAQPIKAGNIIVR
jgi:hypothetical protein